MNWLGQLVQTYIEENDTVLDIGCGIMCTIEGLDCKSYLGVDIWKPYLASIKSLYSTISLDASKDLDKFLDKSFDVVLCLDLLEHLECDKTEYVLDNLIRIARKKVIVFTPSTFHMNFESSQNAWNMGACEHQLHKCLIKKEQLERHGFIVNTDNIDNAYFGVLIK